MGWLFFLIAGICVCASFDSTPRVRVESSVSLACDVDAASTQPVYDLWGTIVDAFDVWDGVAPRARSSRIILKRRFPCQDDRFRREAFLY